MVTLAVPRLFLTPLPPPIQVLKHSLKPLRPTVPQRQAGCARRGLSRLLAPSLSLQSRLLSLHTTQLTKPKSQRNEREIPGVERPGWL